MVLTYQGPKNLKHGSNANISVKLTSAGGAAISGREITVSLGKGRTLQTCKTGKTNVLGVASCIIKKVKAAKVFHAPLTMSFAGDPSRPTDDYAAASKTVKIPVS